jgi:lactoylglutathione lyase
LAYAVDNIYETCQKIMDAGVMINRPPRDGHMAFLKSLEGISLNCCKMASGLLRKNLGRLWKILAAGRPQPLE